MSAVAQPYPAHHGALDVFDAKDELRRAIRSEREKRSPRTRARAGIDLAEVVAGLEQVTGAGCVAAYVSRATEPDTLPLLELLAERGTEVLLPVLGAGLQRDWAWFTGVEDLQVRAPGRPPEPGGPTLGAEALAQAQAIIAPALAVDTSGARLGQGGGWYDRVLAHANPGATVIATVFDEEVYDAASRPLPREPHDRMVDVVATPTGWQWVRTPDAG
ncbi:5-formyltetrahydrofolate cyclo-ligase [Cellulomonas bogoriensis]|uniref:5-formyltetrahydrofolate cyclo-ligase n=1 Tax=Cellulomonas bogoriensis 69B4 = DSM 16987 TaxID=1386082 RepID=A0A0A0BQK4_9CELL|nr:5-formyltetrahydrofolate cyclo-ligase [Cellulomonas bogoriensis]KGM10728.1 5-formyltetrahydrofolate cyclo-ligase [Cellulomonas bogoriensis 69B4 = DSM 16987]